MGEYMSFLFNPNGRVSRKDIWLKYILVSLIASTAAAGIDTAMGMAEVGVLSSLVSLFFLWPGIAVSIKRFHDRGMTGWWVLYIYLAGIFGVLLLLSPFLGIIIEHSDALELVDDQDFSDALTEGYGMALMISGILIVLAVSIFAFVVNYCLAGETGPNRFGPDPLDPLEGTADAFN